MDRQYRNVKIFLKNGESMFFLKVTWINEDWDSGVLDFEYTHFNGGRSGSTYNKKTESRPRHASFLLNNIAGYEIETYTEERENAAKQRTGFKIVENG